MTGEVRIVGLGARVHLYARPSAREALISPFRDVLACNVAELDFGLAHPWVEHREPQQRFFVYHAIVAEDPASLHQPSVNIRVFSPSSSHRLTFFFDYFRDVICVGNCGTC